jgi:hypothetical protein
MLIEEAKPDFYENIRRLCLDSRIVSDSIKSMCRTCGGNVKKLSKISREIGRHSVVIPESKEGRNFREDFDKTYGELCDKGRIGGLFKLLHPECQYVIKECQVDGTYIDDMDKAVIIMLSLEVNDMIKDTARIWNNIVKPYGGPLISETLQGIIEMEVPLEKLTRTLQDEKKYMDVSYDIKKAI